MVEAKLNEGAPLEAKHWNAGEDTVCARPACSRLQRAFCLLPPWGYLTRGLAPLSQFGWTLLLIAAYEGHAGCVADLLERRAKVDAADSVVRSPTTTPHTHSHAVLLLLHGNARHGRCGAEPAPISVVGCSRCHGMFHFQPKQPG